MIIAVDYDGTLFANEKPNRPLIDRMRREQQRGSTIILWTCREGKTLAEALRTLRSCGLVPNYVNCNSPEAIRYLGHDTRKILADVYIDDKNARF